VCTVVHLLVLLNKYVIDIVVMIGLHNIRCAGLDHFPLLCLVTEKNYCPQGCNAVKSDIFTGI